MNLRHVLALAVQGPFFLSFSLDISFVVWKWCTLAFLLGELHGRKALQYIARFLGMR